MLSSFLYIVVCDYANNVDFSRFNTRDKKFDWYFNQKEKPGVSEQINTENQEFIMTLIHLILDYSPQSFIVTFSYSLAYKLCGIFLNFDWLVQ